MHAAEGFPVPGSIKVKGHEFVTTMMGAQLLRITSDPRLSEDPKRRNGNPNLEELYRIRLEVQRMFKGAKEKNVDSYAKYIVALEQGSNGVTPQIVFYTPRELHYLDVDNPAQLMLPWDVELVAIDGETQLAARFEAAKIDSATTKQMVDVKICYHRPLEWAKQAFHDLNLLSVRPNAATAISMDMRDPLTSVTRKVAQLPFFKDRVASSRQLKQKDNAICTLSALRTAVVCFSEGIAGLQHGNKPVTVDRSRVPLIEEAAVEYFEALTRQIGPSMEQRDQTVAASPAVMAALGALGHTLANVPDPHDREMEMSRILQTLIGVDWARGRHWDGVAGKIRPDGVFSTAGGAKDSGHTCYAALADNTSAHYRVIRPAAPAER